MGLLMIGCCFLRQTPKQLWFLFACVLGLGFVAVLSILADDEGRRLWVGDDGGFWRRVDLFHLDG